MSFPALAVTRARIRPHHQEHMLIGFVCHNVVKAVLDDLYKTSPFPQVVVLLFKKLELCAISQEAPQFSQRMSSKMIRSGTTASRRASTGSVWPKSREDGVATRSVCGAVFRLVVLSCRRICNNQRKVVRSRLPSCF